MAIDAAAQRAIEALVYQWARTIDENRLEDLAGLLTEESLYGELAEVVAGAKPGRERDDERILFWHRGLATTDIALAHLIVERARERGLGTTLRYR